MPTEYNNDNKATPVKQNEARKENLVGLAPKLRIVTAMVEI
jgi:hypothetical protein